MMNCTNKISSYLCHVIGESPERASRFHASTVRRTKAFAIAIHIPVFLWAIFGFLIASQIFYLADEVAALVGGLSALLIYMIERLVLATPKGVVVNIARVFIGLVISILGASTVDLIIFDREIQEQLNRTAEANLVSEHDEKIALQTQLVEQKKADWFRAQEAANCEANGTCGSNIRSIGPVYRELARQAEFLRQEYVASQDELNTLNANKTQALAAWRANPPSTAEAGLLARVQALHDYTMENTAALIAWALFFTLVLFFELMVVFSKIVFGETVDDELEQIREQISQQKARDYREAVTSPVAGAYSLVESSYT